MVVVGGGGGVVVGQGEKLRLWVVAKGGPAKILWCFKQRNFFLFFHSTGGRKISLGHSS